MLYVSRHTGRQKYKCILKSYAFSAFLSLYNTNRTLLYFIPYLYIHKILSVKQKMIYSEEVLLSHRFFFLFIIWFPVVCVEQTMWLFFFFHLYVLNSWNSVWIKLVNIELLQKLLNKYFHLLMPHSYRLSARKLSPLGWVQILGVNADRKRRNLPPALW